MVSQNYFSPNVPLVYLYRSTHHDEATELATREGRRLEGRLPPRDRTFWKKRKRGCVFSVLSPWRFTMSGIFIVMSLRRRSTISVSGIFRYFVFARRSALAPRYVK